MTEKFVMVLVGIVITSMAFSGGALYTAYNYEPDREIVGFEWNWRDDSEFWKFINDNYVSEGEWKPHNTALNTIFEELDKKVDGLQGSVTLLQAQGDVTTLPTTTFPTVTSTINLNLELSDNNFQVKPSGYPRDVAAILITGVSEFKDQGYVISITDPSGAFVKDKFGKTLSDGDVSEAWVVPQNAIIGTYVVKITIDDKTDSITFKLI